MDEERNKILCKLLHDLAEGDKNALEGIYVITCRNLILVANRYFNNREDIIALTPQWEGERLPDGRPKVDEKYLKDVELCYRKC